MSQTHQELDENKHIIVISYDAFSIDNWESAKSLPNLANLIENGSASSNVVSVYPTFTYVIHTSYVTGMYPEKHGVYHNNPLQPFVPADKQTWFWYRHNIKVPTIFEAVQQAGLTSASLLWPVTGKAKINYNVPEIRAINNENQALKILKNGSPLYSLRLEMKYGHIRKGIAQPYLDDFTTACAVDTIIRKKPNLFMIHLIDLDDMKHEKGTVGDHIDLVLKRMDNRIGQIVDATKEAGIYNNTTFIVIGDHGQKDVHTMLHLNRLFLEKGLIYEYQGQLKWRAYVQGAGGAAYVYITQGDEAAEREVVELLEACIEDEKYGIAHIFNKEQVAQFKSSTHANFMLEAKEGFCFEDDIDKPIIEILAHSGKVYATHGYLPSKANYTSNVVISGHDVLTNKQIVNPKVIDLAPTLAKLLHIPFVECDGRAWDEVIKG